MPARARMLLVILCSALAITSAAVSQAEKVDLAEGKYKYISTSEDSTVLTGSWAEFARGMPNWKEKAKKAHYRFKEGVQGRKCDQRDCHPGFRDTYVNKLVSLPEGEQRMQARQERSGLTSCGDCHSFDVIREKTSACRMHFQLTDLVQCTSCHAEGEKRLIPLGDKKTVALGDHDGRLDWPAHMLTKEEKQISCDKNCHVKDNLFSVKSVCADCHGKDKMELDKYVTANVLVHSTARDSIIPDFIRTIYKILIFITVVFIIFFILMDFTRSREKGGER